MARIRVGWWRRAAGVGGGGWRGWVGEGGGGGWGRVAGVGGKPKVGQGYY